MPLEQHDVEKIAHLARLTLTTQEVPQYAKVLSAILSLVADIKKADTEAILPMAHPLETLHQRLREDVVTEEDQRTLFQTIAPCVEAGLYLVPKVIEEE